MLVNGSYIDSQENAPDETCLSFPELCNELPGNISDLDQLGADNAFQDLESMFKNELGSGVEHYQDHFYQKDDKSRSLHAINQDQLCRSFQQNYESRSESAYDSTPFRHSVTYPSGYPTQSAHLQTNQQFPLLPTRTFCPTAGDTAGSDSLPIAPGFSWDQTEDYVRDDNGQPTATYSQAVSSGKADTNLTSSNQMSKSAHKRQSAANHESRSLGIHPRTNLETRQCSTAHSSNPQPDIQIERSLPRHDLQNDTHPQRVLSGSIPEEWESTYKPPDVGHAAGVATRGLALGPTPPANNGYHQGMRPTSRSSVMQSSGNTFKHTPTPSAPSNLGTSMQTQPTNLALTYEPSTIPYGFIPQNFPPYPTRCGQQEGQRPCLYDGWPPKYPAFGTMNASNPPGTMYSHQRHRKRPKKSQNAPSKRRTGEECLGHGEHDCHKKQWRGNLDPANKRCDECFIKWQRNRGDAPHFELSDRILDFDAARAELFPIPEGLTIPGDDTPDRRSIGYLEDRYVESLLAAINKKYTGSKDSLDDYLASQQIAFNKKQWDCRDWYNDVKVTAHLRCLMRSLFLFHIGGCPYPLPIDGSNSGYRTDFKTKFSVRFGKIRRLLEVNKNVAMNVIEGRGMLALIWNPDEFAKRKNENSKSNTNKRIRMEQGRMAATQQDDRFGGQTPPSATAMISNETANGCFGSRSGSSRPKPLKRNADDHQEQGPKAKTRRLDGKFNSDGYAAIADRYQSPIEPIESPNETLSAHKLDGEQDLDIKRSQKSTCRMIKVDKHNRPLTSPTTTTTSANKSHANPSMQRSATPLKEDDIDSIFPMSEVESDEEEVRGDGIDFHSDERADDEYLDLLIYPE